MDSRGTRGLSGRLKLAMQNPWFTLIFTNDLDIFQAFCRSTCVCFSGKSQSLAISSCSSNDLFPVLSTPWPRSVDVAWLLDIGGFDVAVQEIPSGCCSKVYSIAGWWFQPL